MSRMQLSVNSLHTRSSVSADLSNMSVMQDSHSISQVVAGMAVAGIS